MGKNERAIRILLHGLPYFCDLFPAILRNDGWEIQHVAPTSLGTMLKLVREIARTDLLYVWGARISMGKVLWAARLLGKKKIVMFWCGSDTLIAQREFAEGKFNKWVAGQVHWAGAPWLAEEIRALGIACEYVPVTWIPTQERIAPLPEKFSVLTYMPSVPRGKLYGLDRILSVARSLPHIPFELVGLLHGEIPDPPANLKIFGRTPAMREFYERASVYWRPVAHDGLAFMSLEALSYGRHVMWSYPFPNCARTTNPEMDRGEVERLYGLHQSGALELNRAGIEMVKENFAPERIKKNYLRRWKEMVAPGSVATELGRRGEEVRAKS